jgi:hypothetical protein
MIFRNRGGDPHSLTRLGRAAPFVEGTALPHTDLTEWIGRPIELLVTAITEIDLPVREAMRDGPLDLRKHERYFSNIQAFWEIELGGAEPVRERTDRGRRLDC